MMKLYYLLLPILALFFITSCIPEPEPIDETPKAKGIYECYIDGVEFRANGPNFANQWSPNPHVSYTELGGSFTYLISNRELNQRLYVTTDISLNSTGSYKLSGYTEFLDYDIKECDLYYRYSLVQHKDYFIEITHLDKEHDIIVGSYECELVSDCTNDTLHVYGSFDLEYSL